jgi:DNA repair exonuclease SbcCD nuclease subunit
MSTIITIGDPHFQMNNMGEVKKFVQMCIAYVKRHERTLHAIVVLGDVLHDHERVHSTALNVAVDFLNKLSEIAPTYVLVGNHDLINNSQFLTQNHWMNALKNNKNITVVDEVVEEMWDDKTVVMVPYVPNGRLVEALNTGGDWKEADIIFAHQEIKGVKMGSIISEDGDCWNLDWPFMVTGHIHQNQTPQPNVYYPGSALQVAFGESDRNIIAEVNLHNLSREGVNEVDLGLQKKKILYTDASDLIKVIKKIEPGGTYEHHKLKVCVDGTKEEFKALKKTAAFKKLQQKGVKVVYKRKRAAIKADNMRMVEARRNMLTGRAGFSEILTTLVMGSISEELRVAYNYNKLN